MERNAATPAHLPRPLFNFATRTTMQALDQKKEIILQRELAFTLLIGYIMFYIVFPEITAAI